ncbi:MAG: KH domain-containing protein [Leptospirales bacterium]|nr:KH domain-containing protein [Leptospirales bacterium]
MDYKELVYYIVRSLVDNPDKVDINEIEGEKSTILELKVARDDMGKIIGKHGRITRAIRTLINVPAVKNGKRVVLEILD